MPYAAQWYASERPSYSFYCVCGLAITGQSEKGLHTLIRKHREKGIFHLEHTGETTMTPIPGGEITSTETWTEVPAVTDEAILAADAEEAVEEYIPDSAEK